MGNISNLAEKTNDRTVFVKYACGCIGLPPTLWGNVEQSLIFKICDPTPYDGPGGFCMILRDMAKKEFEYLSLNETNEIMREISGLVHDGYSMKAVRILINQP